VQSSYKTSRLLLNELSISDAEFILELVNTPEWIKFIGDRNINSIKEAGEYIQKIIGNPAINYWVVKMTGQTPMGIITFIKRDYLDYHDIGFAFLSEYTGQGYAYEATMAVLSDVIKEPAHSRILATTVKENVNSIKLLEKLGFRYEGQIQNGNEMLFIYTISANFLNDQQAF
jgi:RimJ/RimL family protein N-acetyltransferase